ncbi:hypothetical protein [Roseivirga sp.]|uniref:hypothetical protein n=1 Tax=Roseivirga sp. TaxID=1964215 RepID=UPI003B8D739F
MKEFYKENAGFLLLTMGLVFGFLKTPEHIAIASALAFNPLYYLVVLVLWAFYTFKTYHFCSSAKLYADNWFLTEVVLISPHKRRLISIYLQGLMLAPILGYGLFLFYQAILLGQISSAIMVGLGNLVLLIFSATLLDKKLIKPNDSSASTNLNKWWRFLPKVYPFYFIHHLFHRHGFSLLLTKIFSISLIFGATAIFHVEGIDLRYLGLGMLLTSAANSSFTLKHKLFDANDLKLFRNLPLSNINIYGKDSITYLILAIPEILVLLGNNISSVPMIDLLRLALLLPCVLLLHKSISMLRGKDMEQFMKYVFFSTAIIFFVILGYADLFLIEAGAILISSIIYLKFRASALVE